MPETMETGSELLRRVNEAMSGTIQEQLKELVFAARAGIEQFSDAASQQGTILADAHAGIVDANERLARALGDARMQLSEDLKMGMEELSRAREADKSALESVIDQMAQKVAAMDTSVTDAMDILRTDVEEMHNTADARAQEAFSVFTARVEWQMTAMENDLKTRAQEMHDEFSRRATAMEATIASGAERAESARMTIVSRIDFLERAVKDVREQMERTVSENNARFEQIMKKLEDTSGIEERAAHHLVSLLEQAVGRIAPCETPEVVEAPSPLSA